MADPDQDILDFYNQSHGSPSPGGSPTATMTPDPDQDILDFYNKSRSPTPAPTAAPSRSPYTDQAVQAQSTTLNPPEKPGIVSTVAGSAARGFLPGRAMLAAYPYGSVAGAALAGAARGALVGAAVPVAGETGISEAIGGVLGGLIAGGIAAWGASKLQTAAADVISPEGAFSSKTEQAQVAAHPYAAIVGGGLSFGKPNPMNVIRAGKTLASSEGRAAMVAFTKTGGKGMSSQAIDEAGNVINVAMAGGLNSAFNVKDQIESGHFDPGQLAVAAATGFIFNEPWFHKPNPAAAAAAKTMSQFGVPGAGPSPPGAPPGIAAPPGVPPPGAPSAPRVPGLFDFMMPPPASETARAPEKPLPEAPIPPPGTETTTTPTEGGPSATQERPVTESRVEEHIGVPPGENVPAHPAEVRKVGSEQAGDSGGAGAAETEPVNYSYQSPEVKTWWEKAAEIQEAYNAAEKGSPERTALRKAFEEHWDQVQGTGDKFARINTETGELERPASVNLAENSPNLGRDLQWKPSNEEVKAGAEPVAREAVTPETEGAPATPYSIKEKNGLFIVEDSRDPSRVTSAPKRTLEEAQQRKAILDKTFEKNELARMQQEHEAELLAEAQGHQEKGGDELLDAVAEHGVPFDDPNYKGELQNLQEHFGPRGKYGQEKHRKLMTGERLNFGDVFQKDAGSMDSLTQFLKYKGFDVETPDDTIALIDERLRSGKKVYGDEARAQALEEQSYQDYQGPMRAKHPFGGFFRKKEPTPDPAVYPGYAETKPIKDPQVLHDTLEQDKGLGAETIESTPGEDTLEMGMNKKQIARRLGLDSYKESIGNVTVKELIQNAFDSVKSLLGITNENPARIHVDVDPYARTITVTDKGTGMSPQVIKDAFFTIGGSFKGTRAEDTSGGHGIAKIGFMYGAKRVRLETINDGLKSVVDATGEQIQDGQFKLIKTRTDEPNGTKVTVEIPETYIDANGDTKHVYFEREPSFLKKPLFGPVEVIYNGAALPMGIHTRGWQKDNVFNFGWGHVDVYVDPKPTVEPKYSVLSAGLHQFDVSDWNIFGFGDAPKINHNMVFDVRSSVRSAHPDYPFNNQREGFQGKREADVADMWNYLKRQALEQHLLNAKDTFSKLQQLPEVDPEKNLTQAQLDEINAAYTQPKRPMVSDTGTKTKSVTFTPDSVVTTHTGGGKTVQTREAYTAGERTFKPERDVDFEKTKLDVKNLDPNKPYLHNNTNVEYDDIPGSRQLITQVGNTLVKFMRHFGDKLNGVENYGQLVKTDGSGWFGGISFDKSYAGLNTVNPIRAIWNNFAALSHPGQASPRAAAAETMHLFLHELTHVPQRNEGGGFTRELATNYARLETYNIEAAKFQKILENIYAQHWDALKQINERHQSYDTRNSAESFKAGSALGPEPGREKTAGEGTPSEHAPSDVGVQEQGRTGAGRAGEANPDAGPIGEILAGQKSRPVPGAEPAHPKVAAPAPQPERVAPTAPVPEGVSGRGGVAGIRDTLSGIREAAAQPLETPEQRQFAPPLEVQTGEHEVRPPTPSESASPRRDMSEQEMSKTIENSLQRFHEEALTTSGTSSGGLSHNDIIDAGRNAIRHGVDPEAVAGSRAIPVDQKYTVTRAHGEDLRDMAEAAEDLARRNPSQVNKDAAEAAFADYSNWDKETVRPLRKAVEEQYPGMPPEEFNPRSMTDLRQQMIRQNNRDFSTKERVKAEAQLKEVERTTMARNKELMKWDEELRKGSPELIKDIKNGDDLFEYVANVMKKLFPCS